MKKHILFFRRKYAFFINKKHILYFQTSLFLPFLTHLLLLLLSFFNLIEHFMVDTIPLDTYDSLHIGGWSVFKNDFLRNNSFDQNGFSKGITVIQRFGNKLFCSEFDLLTHKVHDTDLQLVLAIFCLFELAQMHKAFLLALFI
jgi:hypothetical protein